MKGHIELAYTPRVTGVCSSPQLSQYIVLPCCTAAHTRPVPNVALSSPHEAAIECFLGCLDQRFPLPTAPVGRSALWEVEGGVPRATMGQVCFSAISSDRALLEGSGGTPS